MGSGAPVACGPAIRGTTLARENPAYDARDNEHDADRPIDVIADCRARNTGNERDDGEGWAGRAMELLGVFRLVDLIRIEVLAHIMLPTGCSLPLQVAGGSVPSLRADTRLYGSCYHR